MQACKWVIGATPYLDQAHAAWAAAFPQEMIEKITLAQNARHQFDLTPLNQLDPTQGSIFVAFDERFGNFKRAELMQAVMERGFKLESFVSPRASVAGIALHPHRRCRCNLRRLPPNAGTGAAVPRKCPIRVA